MADLSVLRWFRNPQVLPLDESISPGCKFATEVFAELVRPEHYEDVNISPLHSTAWQSRGFT